MKTITFNGCSECPFSETSHCGKQLVCKHPKVMVAKPYAKDRRVDTRCPEFCPISNADFEVWTFEQFVEYGKSVSDNIVNGMPWSFEFKGFAVSHENDEKYVIITPISTIYFKKGYILIYRTNELTLVI